MSDKHEDFLTKPTSQVYKKLTHRDKHNNNSDKHADKQKQAMLAFA